MVGGHHGQVVGAQTPPKILVMVVVSGAERRRAHVAGPLEARGTEVVFQVQVEVLGAGLGVDVVALIAGRGDPLQGLAGRQVHEVDRRAGHQGQLDSPVGGLTLQPGRPGDAVIDRVGLAAGRGLFGEHVDGDAVLGVHADHGPVFGGLLHDPEDLPVVGVEDPWVGHEQLETGDSLGDQGVHLLDGGVVDTAEDHVEGVVDGALTFGLGEPGVEAFTDVLAVALHGEVDDGGGATPCRGPGADFESVGGEGAAKGQFHVGVAVDAAGHHIAAGGVDDRLGTRGGRGRGVTAWLEQGSNRLPVDEYVDVVAAGGADHGSVLDEGRHSFSPCFRSRVFRSSVSWAGVSAHCSRPEMARTRMSAASSTSSAVTVIGGAIRRTLP